ncbi:TPA: hypothetical protein QDB02_004755 [Burkholderia vietnamiensis]|uniref:hypothetical protein n=1 Tax=Burkholderia orbicola TaxID=2978683 RepID=UPI002FE37B7B|nr:hypothetical protein [Burkholderia vietnamiensis]
MQSIWERQLRTRLSDCVHHYGAGDAAQLRSARMDPFDKLSTLLHQVRDAELTMFPSYPDLEYLQLVGNACRHGDGRSSDALFRAHPELWPAWTSAPLPWPTDRAPIGPPAVPSFRDAVLPRPLLTRFVDAIAWFWEDVSYVCMNSFARKNDGIEEEMAAMRCARAARCAHDDTVSVAAPRSLI